MVDNPGLLLRSKENPFQPNIHNRPVNNKDTPKHSKQSLVQSSAHVIFHTQQKDGEYLQACSKKGHLSIYQYSDSPSVLYMEQVLCVELSTGYRYHVSKLVYHIYSRKKRFTN